MSANRTVPSPDPTCDRLLVTGGTGFLGSEVVRQALRAGIETRVLTRRETSLPDGADGAVGDVLDPETLRKAIIGCRWVIHAAGLAHDKAPGGREPEQTNVRGTENVVRAAAEGGANRTLLVSSVSVYGEGSANPRNEESPCRPVGPYASSKYHAELRATGLSKKLGLDLVILRLSTLYGEGDPGNVARLIRGIDRGHFVMLGSGENRKSLLHRDDAARACLEAVRKASPGFHVYNVVGTVARMAEIVTIVAQRLGRRPIRIPLSDRIVSALSRLSGSGRLRTFFRDDVFDGSRFEKEFGFRSEVPLEEGLNRQVDWYRRRKV